MAHENIIIPRSLFLSLKETLVSTVGIKKTKSFLLKMGMDLGKNIAQLEIEQKADFNKDTPIHAKLGHVSSLLRNGELKKLPDGTVKCENISGIWFDSFEANNQLSKGHFSEEPVCLFLSGFATGYLSYIYQENLITKEIKCRARGDNNCEFEIRKESEWKIIDSTYLMYFNDQPIITELESTYDQLVNQQILLNKIDSLHDLLTQALLQKKPLTEILSVAFQTLDYPILIRTSERKVYSYVGIEEKIINSLQPLKKLKAAYDKNSLKVYKHNDNIFEYILTADYDIDKFHCSFLLSNFNSNFVHDAQLFLERLSNILNIYFLNQNIHSEAQARVKMSILELLLNKQYQDIEDMYSYLAFLHPKFSSPFFTISIKLDQIESAEQNPDKLYSYILKLSTIFESNNIPILLIRSPYNKNELIGLFSDNINEDTSKVALNRIVSHWNKKNIQMHIGISSKFTNLEFFIDAINQSRIALNYPHNQIISSYDDLGLLKNLIDAIKFDEFEKVALDTLQPLLKENSVKKNELVHTLYTFLKNDKKFEKTMQLLNLSIGGLQYRLKKIEGLLTISFKDSQQTSYLLVLLDFLIATNKLQIKL